MVLSAEAVARGLAVVTRIAPTDRLIHIHIAIVYTATITLDLRMTLFPIRFIIIISPDQQPVFAGSDDWS
jgi:hypothetical protein